MPSHHHRLSSILAARTGTRQVDVVYRADQAAVGIDRAIGSVWQELLGVLKTDRGYSTNFQQTFNTLQRLQPVLQAALAERLRRLAVWGHRSAATVLSQTLPLDYLRAAAPVPVEALESMDATLLEPGDPASRPVGAAVPVPDLLADRPDAVREDEDDRRRMAPERLGSIHADGSCAHNQHVHRQRLWLTEDEDPGTEPAVPQPSGEALRRLFQALLFPPPPLELVNRIVFGPPGPIGWPQRIASLSRLAPPLVIADIVANGFSQGLSQRAIAKQLEPLVNNVRSSARRIARTEGLRVSHQIQQRCHDALGDLVIANQVHATLDANTRPWHAARSGTVYYRDPAPGEKGPAQQPNPPEEAADASERPPNTPQTAPNCRCFVSPVLSPQQDIINDPAKLAVFKDNAGNVIPDTVEMQQWFERADDRRRTIAVGAKRYAAVRDRLEGGVALPDGRKVEFTAPPHSKGKVLVYVDPAKLDADFAKDKAFYIPPGGGGAEIGGRREGFNEFLKKGKAVEASSVVLAKDGSLSFVDGRHRFSVLRDAGAPRVAISVPAKQAKAFRERYGAPEPARAEPVTYAHFLNPRTGGLLSAKELKAESAEQRSERVAKAQALIARRGELIKQTATYGFLVPAA